MGNRIAAVLTTLLLLCGCSVESQEKAEGVTFTDALGRVITAPENPERTAALLGSFAEVWQLAGGTVCAAADDAWEDFDLAMGDAVNLGGAHSPSLELLLSSSPVFVLASASTAADVEMEAVLENAGITVAYFDVDCFSDYLAMLDICTDITGRKDLYEQNGLKIQREIEAAKKNLEYATVREKERTVLLLRASSGAVKAKGSKGTVLGEMLSDMGCINVADSENSLLENLSVESIIRSEPYRIFVVNMGDAEAAKENVKQMMEENPAWRTLAAIREGRLYFMDGALFNRKPNVRWGEAYAQLNEILRG